jgi:hypothetical protein
LNRLAGTPLFQRCQYHKGMFRLICAGVICAALTAGQGKGYGKGKEKGHSSQADSSSSALLSFGRDADVIRQYCRNLPPNRLPPGLAKRGGDLPPGLKKQLQRNGRLPPGLEKKVYAFPPELEQGLPALPPDYARAFIGGRAVLYNKSTSVILDVFVPF